MYMQKAALYSTSFLYRLSTIQPDVEIGSITKKIASQQYTGLD
jgi:hypothetical protein